MFDAYVCGPAAALVNRFPLHQDLRASRSTGAPRSTAYEPDGFTVIAGKAIFLTNQGFPDVPILNQWASNGGGSAPRISAMDGSRLTAVLLAT